MGRKGSGAAPRRRRGRLGLWLLPLVGLLPGLALALLSLTEPWASARVVLVWGVSRSPGAQVLVLVAVLGTLAATVAVAGRGRYFGIAAAVHLVAGALMYAVARAAYSMVSHAGVRALGLLPLASVHPGPGLRHFTLGSLLVMALGLVELVLALTWHRKRRRLAPPADSPAPGR